jgi:uncharacterized membrane-anchored protein
MTEHKFDRMLSKVPEVTIGFWIIKILSTTVGETGADYLAVDVGWGMAKTSFLMALFLLGSLFIQFKARKYVPWMY